MTDYFVTGVAGGVASRLIPLLASRPDTGRVIGIDRRSLVNSSPKLHFMQAEMTSDFLDEALMGVEVVIHLATSAPANVVSGFLEKIHSTDVRHVVMLSSATTFGAWADNPVPLVDDAPLRPNPEFSYAINLAEVERLSVDWQKAHPEIVLTILRPTMILGGGLEKRLTEALSGMNAYRELNSNRPVQFLHVDDMTSAIAHVIDKKIGGAFNVAPIGFIGEEKARDIAGPIPRPSLPRRLARFFNTMLFRVKSNTDYRMVEPYLRYPWIISSDSLRNTGWQPTYSSEETLVAEARPYWWAGLPPGRKRALISNVLFWGPGFIAGTIAILVSVIMRLRRRLR